MEIQKPADNSVILFGGYGVFGSLIAAELAKRGIGATIAGRSLSQARAMAQGLGSSFDAIQADVSDLQSCRTALQGKRIAVHCAGNFSLAGPALLEACLETDCHYVDIADDRRYVTTVQSYHERFLKISRVAAYGCSSLPGISGALALLARDPEPSDLERIRVTLFIGNRNPKGTASIRSAAKILGRPIRTPQGEIRGFRDREVIPLAPPFHRRAAYNFESPDYDLLPKLLGAKGVVVKVAFELRMANLLFSLLARGKVSLGEKGIKLLQTLSAPFQSFGSSGGAVMAELFYGDGKVRRASLTAREQGQRMAILPCVLIVQALLDGSVPRSGAGTVYELLGNENLLKQLADEGCEVRRS